jgi:serine-type D-Ala-D-Ala carboxypeptidase (penicillin-binding protein 5/6)
MRTRRRSGWAWLLAVVLVLGGAVAVALVTPGVLDSDEPRGGAAERTATPGGGAGPEVTPAPQIDEEFSAYGRRPAARKLKVRFDKPPNAGLLFDVKTGEVLWSRNPRRTREIASLTKMMTAILVARHLDPDDKVRISRRALNYQGSGVGLLLHKREFQVETLLYGLMLPSGNDAALALAEGVSGSVRRFVNLMNAEARRLGLRCTRFSGPDGFNNGNRSCARDLAVLARVVLRDRRLRRIVRTRKAIRKAPVKGRRLFLYNHNPLQRLKYPGVTGVKTGFTNEAGRCFVATARRGGHHLGVVLLKSPNTGGQARSLLDRGFRAVGV